MFLRLYFLLDGLFVFCMLSSFILSSYLPFHFSGFLHCVNARIVTISFFFFFVSCICFSNSVQIFILFSGFNVSFNSPFYSIWDQFAFFSKMAFEENCSTHFYCNLRVEWDMSCGLILEPCSHIWTLVKRPNRGHCSETLVKTFHQTPDLPMGWYSWASD